MSKRLGPLCCAVLANKRKVSYILLLYNNRVVCSSRRSKQAFLASITPYARWFIVRIPVVIRLVSHGYVSYDTVRTVVAPLAVPASVSKVSHSNTTIWEWSKTSPLALRAASIDENSGPLNEHSIDV